MHTHPHTCKQCSPASVGFAQVHPKKQVSKSFLNKNEAHAGPKQTSKIGQHHNSFICLPSLCAILPITPLCMLLECLSFPTQLLAQVSACPHVQCYVIYSSAVHT